MVGELLQLYSIAALAAQFVEMIDDDGGWPQRPSPRDLERLAKRLRRMIADAEAVFRPDYAPPPARAAQRDAKKREAIVRSIESFGDDLRRFAASRRRPEPFAPPVSPEPIKPNPTFTQPDWLIALPSARDILKS